MKKKMVLLASSPLTIKAFFPLHLEALGREYEVTVLTNLTGLSPTENFGHEHVRVVHVDVHRAITPVSDFRTLVFLYSLMRREHFDALLTVTPKAGLLGMLAGTLSAVPVRIHWFTGQLWASMHSWRMKVFKAIDRVIAHFATAILVDSKAQLMFLIQQKVLTPGQGTVLGNGSISGVDAKRFRPNPRKRQSIRAKFDISADTLLVLFLGRLTLDKGLLDLARAVSATDPSHKIGLMCVGPDEGRMSLEIEEVVKESGRRVHFVDATDYPEYYLAAADLLCLPSYREGFGSSVLEAAAVNVPAITSDIYGLRDAIIDGFSGLVFPVRDVGALTAALDKMAGSPALRKKLGGQAREWALAGFSGSYLTSELLRYIGEQLDPRPEMIRARAQIEP